MGLTKEYLSFIDKSINCTVGDLYGKTMLELGNQIIRKNEIPEKTGKEYYTNRGLVHKKFKRNY